MSHTLNARQAPDATNPAWVRLLDAVERRFLAVIGTWLLLLAAFLMLSEVVTRSTMHITQGWLEEAIRYLMLWAVFLLVGHAYRSGHLVRTELVYALFGPKARYWLAILNSLLAAVFACFLLWAAWIQVRHLHRIGITGDELHVPLWIMKSSLIVGALGLLLFAARALYDAARGVDPFAGNEIEADDD